MFYQFLDWRLAGRKLYAINIERLLERLRESNREKRLTLYLSTWEEYQIFAGEAGIMLPEMEAAAKAVFNGNDSYPTLGFLEKEYTKLLQHVATSNPELLKEQSPPPPPPSTKNFKEEVEGSVSNVTPKETEEGDKSCSVQSPAISSPTLISTVSPNTLLTAQKSRQQPQPN